MMNSIAGITVALKEASTQEFVQYSKQVIKNAQTLAKHLIKKDFNIITDGTDKHLILIDIRNKQPDGHIAAQILEAADIITNKHSIPFDDTATPWRPSGIRIGTPSITTRGMDKTEMKEIAKLIDEALRAVQVEPNTKTKDLATQLRKNEKIADVRKNVRALTSKFPIYTDLN